MAICSIDLTTANIQNLFCKTAIDADETLSNDTKYVLMRIADSTNAAEFADFLAKIGKEARDLGLCCQAVKIDTTSATVVCGHAPYEAAARGDLLSFKVNTYGDVYIWELKLNRGTFENPKWVRQPQVILDRLGASKDRCNRRSLYNFNFKISWLKNWLKKGAECTEKIRLDEIAARKHKKHNELKKEAWAGRVMSLADLIAERLPGVKVKITDLADDGSEWYFSLYNVQFTVSYGATYRGLFLPKDAYVGWNPNDDFEWVGMHVDMLKDVRPIKLYTLFTTLADSKGQVVCGNSSHRKIDYGIALSRRPDSAKRGAGTWDIVVPAPIFGYHPSVPFRGEMIPTEELGDWFNALLDYEAAAYDIAVKAAEDIMQLNKTAGLNRWNRSNMGN